MSWTQPVTECNAEMKHHHPMHLTQGSIAHHYFWEGGQARFPALSSSPHSMYSRWGLYRVPMEHSSPFMGDPAPTVNRHTTTVGAGRHILSCNALPSVRKIKPAHHLLS